MPEPLNRLMESSDNLALLAPMLLLWWGLATCLLGYLIVRVNLVMVGVCCGVLAGTFLAQWRADTRHLAGPTGADMFVLCGSLSIMAALISWYMYRVVLGVYVALGVCAGILHWFFNASVQMQVVPTHAWLISGLPALVLGLAVLIWTRSLVMILSGLLGAALAVYSAALVLAEGQPGLRNWLGGPNLDPVPLAVLAGATLALAVGGIRLQFRLPALAARWFKPAEALAKPAAPKPAPAA